MRIDELEARVAAALDRDDGPKKEGRVRAVPDVRTIRYYTTIGLLDRPEEMRGRTALYGERHVLQLVAIKRLQAEGLALEEIQARLAGASGARLAEIARIDAAVAAPPVSARAESFWRAAPEATEEIAPAARPLIDSTQHEAATTEPWALALSAGVTLVVHGKTRPSEAARRRLLELSRPLSAAIESLGEAEGEG